MASTVTQTRKVAQDPKILSFDYRQSPTGQFSNNSFDNGVFAGHTQTTTSFRGSKSEIVPDEGNLSDATSMVDFYRRMGNEVRENRSGYDTGHTFDTTKSWMETSHTRFTVTGNNSTNSPGTYRGPLIVWQGSSSGEFPVTSVYPPVSPPALGTYGASAIAATIPTNSLSSLAVDLGELILDGLPSAVGQALLHSKLSPIGLITGLAHEHLNWNFGLAPLGSDIGKAAAAIRDSKKILDQYRRDSGRQVRRRFSFPTIKTTTSSVQTGRVVNVSPYTPSWTNNLTKWTGPITRVTETSHKIWFSGAYSYYINMDDKFMANIEGYAREIDHLTGLGLDPEAVWQLIPWSWLLGWFSDLNTIIHNVNAFAQDSLVLRYGYLMCESTVKDTHIHPGITSMLGEQSGPLSTTYHTVRKQRIKASPYGFGLNPNSFTDRQWSILTALGLTKGSGARSLR